MNVFPVEDCFHFRPREPLGDSRLIRPDWTVPRNRDPRLLWLDKNENCDPHMTQVVRRLWASLDPVLATTYPDCGSLYRKLARFSGVEPDQLLLSTGADGCIRSVFETFIEPGDTVIHLEPTYSMYKIYCSIFGADTEVINYVATSQGPELSIDTIRSAVQRSRPKLICLPNPASPTGTVIHLDQIRDLAELASDCGSLLLVDEAYHPFHPVSVVPLVSAYPNVIVVRTFSKAWAVAGLRIGYAIVDRAVSQLLHKVQPSYEVNHIAIGVADLVMDEEVEMWESVKRLNNGRNHFVDKMHEFGLRTAPSAGNFLLVEFADQSETIHAALADLALYRHDFGHPSLAGYSRFTATTVELFEPIIERIRQVVTAVA